MTGYHRGPRLPEEQLRPREIEVLQLAADGHTRSSAAAELYLAPQTVKMHLASARRRLGAKTTTAAVVAALRKGLIS